MNWAVNTAYGQVQDPEEREIAPLSWTLPGFLAYEFLGGARQAAWLDLNKDSHGGMFRCPVKLDRKSPGGFLLGPSKRWSPRLRD